MGGGLPSGHFKEVPHRRQRPREPTDPPQSRPSHRRRRRAGRRRSHRRSPANRGRIGARPRRGRSGRPPDRGPHHGLRKAPVRSGEEGARRAQERNAHHGEAAQVAPRHRRARPRNEAHPRQAFPRRRRQGPRDDHVPRPRPQASGERPQGARSRDRDSRRRRYRRVRLRRDHQPRHEHDPGPAQALMPGAGTRPTFPYSVVETVLDNGLLVVAVPLDTPGLAAHYIAVRTGSRNETEAGRTGFAHFFEHMMFRGTERTTPERYNELLKRLGADGNAFTTDDWTCYHVVAASSGLATVMDLEADRFMNLRYGLEAFQKEAAAVLGEYNKNASIPFNALFEKLHDTAYTTHTYKHTTMGFLKDIEVMPLQYDHSLAFFERWYRSDNAALVVAGDIVADDVFALARRYYGAWRPGGAALTTPVEPAQLQERSAHITWAAPTLPLLAMAFHAPAFEPASVDGRALDVIAQAYFAPT